MVAAVADMLIFQVEADQLLQITVIGTQITEIQAQVA
jgi:hypothetical protein